MGHPQDRSTTRGFETAREIATEIAVSVAYCNIGF